MTTPQARALPATARIGLSRGRLELREFFRRKEAVIFTFSLPAILLLLLGSIEHQQYAGQLLTAGMIGAGVVSTSFVSVGTGIALDREDGTLKRLRGTPMPAAAYFVGKLVLVLVSSLAEVALLLVIGTLVFHVQLPGTGSGWLRLAWVFLLGVVGCTLLGIAASSLARSARSAPAVLNLVFMVLEFISGIFVVPITALPAWMVQVASLFPVKWLAQGLRSKAPPVGVVAGQSAGVGGGGTMGIRQNGLGTGGLVSGRSCAVSGDVPVDQPARGLTVGPVPDDQFFKLWQWEAYFAAVGLLGVVLVWATPVPDRFDRFVGTGLVLLLACWWALLGRRLYRRRAGDAAGLGYFVGVFALTVPLLVLVPNCSWVLFALTPHGQKIR